MNKKDPVAELIEIDKSLCEINNSIKDLLSSKDLGEEICGVKKELFEIDRSLIQLIKAIQYMPAATFVQRWAPEISIKRDIPIKQAIQEAIEMHNEIYASINLD